ncbi:MAG: hypothetical protein WCK77_01595 [Verrucomicrobiota bacterium]
MAMGTPQRLARKAAKDSFCGGWFSHVIRELSSRLRLTGIRPEGCIFLTPSDNLLPKGEAECGTTENDLANCRKMW